MDAVDVREVDTMLCAMEGGHHTYNIETMSYHCNPTGMNMQRGRVIGVQEKAGDY